MGGYGPRHAARIGGLASARHIYLHYVLDVWFHRKWRRTVPEGEALIVRYADDFVSGSNTSGMRSDLYGTCESGWRHSGLKYTRERRGSWRFGRFAAANRKQRRQGRPETFDFLGFTHYCTTTRRGQFQLGRKPMSKRVNRTLKRIAGVLRRRWHDDIWVVGRWLGRVVNGWLNYYAVPGSGRFIRGFARSLLRLWHRALRRRSQRDRFAWKKIERMKELLWPPVTIRHPWPDRRFAVTHPR